MSWKTTFFGLLAAIGGAILAGLTSGLIDPTYLPQWLRGMAGLLSVIGTAGLGFNARDNDKTSEQVGAGQKESGPRSPGTFSLLLYLLAPWFLGTLLAALLTGCARFHSVQIKTDGTARTESRQTITTFWDSQASVAKLRASTTDKTQGLTVGGLNEASESTNVTQAAGEILGAALKALAK